MLLALAWPNHVHHRAALRWFTARGGRPWATTPVTQIAFVRISANPAALPTAVSPGEAVAMLRRICQVPGHTFLADDVDLASASPGLGRVVTHRQVTDSHLLDVAHRTGATLATFDRGIPPLASTPAEVVLIPFTDH